MSDDLPMLPKGRPHPDATTPAPNDPEYYRWRRKAEFVAYHHISLRTAERMVKITGEAEKMPLGRTPLYRMKPAADASESASTALTASETSPELAEVLRVLHDEIAVLRALQDEIRQTRQAHATSDAPWWVTYRWRKKS